MGRVWQSGAEQNSVVNGVEVTANNSSPTIVTSPVHGGTYAWHFNSTAAAINCRQTLRTANQSTIAFVRAYIYISSLPTGNTNILALQNSSNANCGALLLTTAGQLQLINGAAAQVGSNSATLSTGQWYMLGLSVDCSANPGTLTGQLAGSTFATGANSAQLAWEKLSFGILSTTTANIYMDDIGVNDTSGTNQTSWPPDEQIIHLHPTATGDFNQFTVQVGGTAGSTNNYTRVNEVPPDDATSYNASAVLNQEDMFKFGASGIAANSVINTVMVGTRQADLVSADATAGFKAQIEKAPSGTIAQSANIVPNSTTFATNGTAAGSLYPIIRYTDPDNNPWTQATIDTLQAGYIIDAANTQAIAISNVWVSVGYSAGVSTGNAGSTLALMGVG